MQYAIVECLAECSKFKTQFGEKVAKKMREDVQKLYGKRNDEFNEKLGQTFHVKIQNCH